MAFFAAAFLAVTAPASKGKAQPFAATSMMESGAPPIIDDGETVTGEKEPAPDDTYGFEEHDEFFPAKSSSSLRQGKSFAFALEPIGFGVAPIVTFGGWAGMFLTPDTTLEAHYLRGTGAFDDMQVKTEVAGIRNKTFWTDTFYTHFGFAHRNVRVRLDDSSLLYMGEGRGGTSRDSSITTWTLDSAIGTATQFNHVMIGCDWIGVFYPLSRRSLRGFDPEKLESKGEDNRLSYFEKLAEKPTIQLLRFYFGAAF